MKFRLLFLASFTFINCIAQGGFPKDWDLEGLKGAPKRIQEIDEIKSSGIISKEIFYFSPQGNLTKIEHYNVFDADIDSLLLGQITFYEYKDSTTKVAMIYESDGPEMIRLKDYTLVNDKLIRISDKDFNNSMVTQIDQDLDAQKRIIKTTSTVTDKLKKVIILNSSTEFIYVDSKLSSLRINNDKTKGEAKTIAVRNEKTDKLGNFIYRELWDENDKLLYLVKREYEYY